ncbi:MAG: hypothetical protein R3C53_20570 [Pirellulaceae bacterium]
MSTDADDMPAVKQATDLAGQDSPHFKLPTEPAEFAAWEEVESGRFMPRRIRGSCAGRALG